MVQSVWSYDGPNDKNLLEFYTQVNRHFNSGLTKGMFSLELDLFQPVRSRSAGHLAAERHRAERD